MTFRNALTARLGITVPVIQAPMVGASGTALAIAASDAGALGTLAAGALPPDGILRDAANIRAETARPFAINLLMARPADPDTQSIAAAMARLKSWRDSLGLPEQAIPNRWSQDFAAQLQAVIAARPTMASFTFDCLTRDEVTALKAAGIFVCGTATSVPEARAWIDAGADAICAQGAEGGGHRGTFLGEGRADALSTFALVPAIRAATTLPVIAAGGIMDGAGIAAALMLGADAVQLGTAFLLTPEAITPQPWRDALAHAGDNDTRLTRVFSGRYARGLENDFMRKMTPAEKDIPAYPVQNALTREIRAAAAKAGNAGLMSLWAGQGVPFIRAMPAGELISTLWAEACEASGALHARMAAP